MSEAEGRIIEHILQSEPDAKRLQGYNVVSLAESLSMDPKECEDALTELASRNYLERQGRLGNRRSSVKASPKAFWDGDLYVHGWDCREDARYLARILIDGAEGRRGRLQVKRFLDAEGWKLRRINPALKYLILGGIVDHDSTNVRDVVTLEILETDTTRSFLRGDYDPDSRRRA